MSRSPKIGLPFLLFVGGLIGSTVSFAQTPSSNLQYQVANLVADVRLLDERLRQTAIEMEELRRENARLRDLVQNYEANASSSLSRFATVDQLNAAVRKAVSALEARDEVAKKEVIAEVTAQIEAFGRTVNKALGSIPQVAKPDPNVKVDFPKNYPDAGVPYTVAPGESLASIAAKLNSRIDWIQNANKISDPRLLQVGQVIFVPQKAD